MKCSPKAANKIQEIDTDVTYNFFYLIVCVIYVAQINNIKSNLFITFNL